jgi:inner membrane protein
LQTPFRDGGLAAGALYLNLGGAVDHEALFFGSLALGTLIPDIDDTGSSISRKVPFIDNIISSEFGHRSFTHNGTKYKDIFIMQTRVFQ